MFLAGCSKVLSAPLLPPLGTFKCAMGRCVFATAGFTSGQDSRGALEHYCRVVSPRHWQEVTILMLSACFDAAGKLEDKNTPIILVAGFASMSRVWLEFEQRWNAVLEKADIDRFHAGDFAGCKGQFQSFKNNETKKRDLISRLLDVIEECGLRKFGAWMEKGKVAEAKALLGLTEDDTASHPYVLCSRYAVDDLHAFARGAGIHSNVEAVFEKGDPEHLLRKHFTKHDYPDPEFRWSHVVCQKGIRRDPFLGLQAAGWIAWEYYVDVCRVFGLSEQQPTTEGRHAFRVFEGLPGRVNILYASNPLKDIWNQAMKRTCSNARSGSEK